MSKPSFSKKTYTVEYLVQNPPAMASKGLKSVWEAAVFEYMKRSGIDMSNKLNLVRPMEDISFADITRIFNTLIGKRNPPRPQQKVA